MEEITSALDYNKGNCHCYNYFVVYLDTALLILFDLYIGDKFPSTYTLYGVEAGRGLQWLGIG